MTKAIAWEPHCGQQVELELGMWIQHGLKQCDLLCQVPFLLPQTRGICIHFTNSFAVTEVLRLSFDRQHPCGLAISLLFAASNRIAGKMFSSR